MHASKDTHGAGSRAEWDAATPNTLEVRSDRIWLSLAHFGASVTAQPPIFDLSRGGAHPKRIASLLFEHWDTSKNEYEKNSNVATNRYPGGKGASIIYR